jgi:hypothetical protein
MFPIAGENGVSDLNLVGVNRFAMYLRRLACASSKGDAEGIVSTDPPDSFE